MARVLEYDEVGARQAFLQRLHRRHILLVLPAADEEHRRFDRRKPTVKSRSFIDRASDRTSSLEKPIPLKAPFGISRKRKSCTASIFFGILYGAAIRTSAPTRPGFWMV